MQSVQERRKKMEQIQIRQQYVLQLKHADMINEMYGKLRQIKHEMNNQMIYLYDLIERRDYEALDGYIHEMQKQIMQIASPTDYGNQLVNAILWVKQKAAAQQNIPFCVHSSVPSEIPVDGKYVTSILTNLLHNALEASQKTEKPQIWVILEMRQNYFYCCVINRVQYDVLRKNPWLNTTKKDKQNHGFGIKNIKNIANQMRGMVRFSMQKDCFVATVMIPCTEKNKN